MIRQALKSKKRKIIRKGKFIVYILECADGTYYTGYTNDLEKRLARHNKGLASKYTRSRLPVKLVWKKEYKNKGYAMRAEASIKKLTKDKKRELIKIAPADFSLKLET